MGEIQVTGNCLFDLMSCLLEVKVKYSFVLLIVCLPSNGPIVENHLIIKTHSKEKKKRRNIDSYFGVCHTFIFGVEQKFWAS